MHEAHKQREREGLSERAIEKDRESSRAGGMRNPEGVKYCLALSRLIPSGAAGPLTH